MEVVFPKFCGPWTLDLAIFDLEFGFSVKFPPRNRLEGSRIWNPGPNMRKFMFYNTMSRLHKSIIVVETFWILFEHVGSKIDFFVWF